MGTPDFALASLETLHKAGCNIVAILTVPDKPAGRGMEMQQSAVKKYALKNNIPVLQPEKLKNGEFLSHLKSLNADLQVCVAFRMLPEVVWNMPPMGTINLHGSLLPQYRGAAPINWAVINGEKETGVTTFKLQHEIDTGNILLKESFPITEEDTAGTVHDKMMHIGANLLLSTIKGLVAGNIKEQPQTIQLNEIIHHAPKIFTETCRVDANRNVEDLYNLVRGLSPYPAAFTFLKDKKLKIFKAKKMIQTHGKNPGEFESDGKTYLRLVCANGSLQLEEIQLEGKKRMFIEDFLRGYRF